jgi:transcriptional regulator with XRE-family HTH domain
MIDKANQAMADVLSGAEPSSQESHVGQQVRQLRMERGFSIRALAEISGLSVNTLSLIENGKISPSVSTLHRAAGAGRADHRLLRDAVADPAPSSFTAPPHAAANASSTARSRTWLLALPAAALHPCLVTLAPHNGSGAELIVHTGYEFAYCLQGQITYTVDDAVYLLTPGDSLMFESHLPHRWQNEDDGQAQMLLVLAPTDERDRPTHRHFYPADPAPGNEKSLISSQSLGLMRLRDYEIEDWRFDCEKLGTFDEMVQ